jgi:hypothetical protein
MSWGSLEERKKNFLEDCCGGGGDAGGGMTNAVGDVGYQSAASDSGPVAGFDKIVGKARKKRDEARNRRGLG